MIQREQFQIINTYIHEIYKNISDDKRYLDVNSNFDTDTGNYSITIILNKPLTKVSKIDININQDSTEKYILNVIEILMNCKEAVAYSNRTDTRKGFKTVQENKLKGLQERVLKLYNELPCGTANK